VDAAGTVRRPRRRRAAGGRARAVVAISVIGRAAALLGLSVAAACGGTAPGSPFEPDDFASDDFPAGDAFVFGIAQDPGTGAPLANLAVSLTPWDGAAFDQELLSGTLAETVTDRLGQFSFSRIAPGPYVLFVRFHAGFLGYGEVVRLVEARTVPIELTLQPPPLRLGFERPRDGGTVAVVDTAVVTFAPIRLAELATLGGGTEAVYARVDVTSGPTEGGAPRPPLRFEVELDEQALADGRVRVPLEVGSLAGTLRLQPFLGFHLAYRDPRGGSGGLREVRGATIQAVRR
jgi:hypothetical protein